MEKFTSSNCVACFECLVFLVFTFKMSNKLRSSAYSLILCHHCLHAKHVSTAFVENTYKMKCNENDKYLFLGLLQK